MGFFKYTIIFLLVLGYLTKNVQGIKCYGCNSDVTPDCSRDPLKVTEEITCALAEDTCGVAILSDGSTYRGCSSDMPTTVEQSEPCGTDLCNAQIFPADRLKCFQCEKEPCVEATEGSELPCVTYDQNDQCFTDVIDETDVIRGCVSDYNYVSGVYSKNCTVSGCNNQPATTKFSCLKCDSTINSYCITSQAVGPNCFVTPQGTCESEVLLGRFALCFTYRKDEHVIRGCSSEEPELVAQTRYIRECILEDCNDECIEAPQCYTCDSLIDPDCKDNLQNFEADTCPLETISCHTCRDQENIVRGCGKSEGLGVCTACWDDPGCNNKKMLECYTCTSETDPNCDLMTEPENIDKVICNGNCISTLREGYVVRGCQSNSFDCQPSVVCQSCSEDVCNVGPIPEKILRCHQCDPSDTNCDDEQELEAATECEIIVDDDDMCYVYLNSDNKMVRGCTTDASYAQCQQAGRCVTCSGDGCNSVASTRKFSCLECDSETDPNCKTGVVPGPECAITESQFCEVDVFFGQFDYCYTYHFDEHVRRGCSKKDVEISSQFKYVRECRLENCNDECIEPAECYVCDSQDDLKCIDGISELSTQECDSGEVSCHTCRREDSNIVRGCGKPDGSGECATCWDEAGCNNKKMLECYSCSSETDPDCEQLTDPDSMEKAICNGNCISTLRGEYVIRGCQTNSFDCQTSLTCKNCAEDRCNDGPMPEKRPRCHQCDETDPNCNNEQEESSATDCELVEDEDDECYVYLSENGNLVRGCATDENYKNCEELPGQCFTCVGDGCNSQPIVGKQTCLVCDSEEGEGCKTGPNPGAECSVTTETSCEMDVPFSKYEYCYTYQSGEHVRRGCSKLDPTYSSQFKNVRECNFNNCNDECFASTKCYGCDSTTNENCISSLFGLLVEECEAGEISCHTCRKEDNSIVRGCGNGASGECAACWDDPGCNTKQMLECYTCTSETDPNCDLWTQPEGIETAICNGNCIATIRDDHVIRGCQSTSFDCPESETCKSCTEDRCNGGRIPEEEGGLRCHQCSPSDPDCDNEQQLSTATTCPASGTEDDGKCYLYMNGDNKMVRGCTTDASYAQCQQAGRCVTCSGDGCNSAASTRKFSCLECDSETDPNCKTGVVPGPECAITESQFCEVDVFFGQFDYCYTYHFDEHVRRGCSKKDVEISSQFKYVRECRLENCNDECIEPAECYVCDSQDDLKCIDGISELSTQECDSGEVSCHTCRREDNNIVRGCGKPDGSGECATCWNEAGCNNKKMLECYSCSSETDPDCEQLTDPDSMEKAICNGNCISTLRGEYVIRGCQTNSFDCQTSLTCKNCAEDRCNDGLMPEKRPRCHQCDETDPNCNNEQEESSATDCELVEDEDDECYVYLSENGNLVRGCATDENYKNCEELPGQCFTCVGDGCNSQPIVGKQTCLECDSEEDEGCKTGPNPGAECSVTTEASCEMDVPFSKYEYCYTYQSGEHVRRGCSKLDPTYSSQFKNVRECNFNNCNDECFASTKCYGCDSTTNENCISSLFGLLVEECEAGEISCHTCRKEDNSIVRGCGNGASGECAACWDDPGCNTKQMLQCYTCTSETDPNCDLWTQPEEIKTAICNGNCIATIRDDHVIRGCQSTSFDCPESETCKSCTEDRCNGGRIPEEEGGLRCHQCGPSDPDCDNEQQLSTATTCPASGTGDDGKCYLYMNGDKKMVRGCTTDESYRDCEELDKGRCITCSGDGCNNEAKISELTCIVCDSENDPSCKGGAFTGPDCAVVSENSCKVDVYFTEYEYCYTHRFGERIQRGCSKDDPELAADYKYVRECRLNNCNDECFEATECYVCDSLNTPNCIESTSELITEECNGGEISCHTCRSSDSTIIRGCGAGGPGECAACWDDPGCNNKKMLECYSCTSADDPNCEEWTQPEQISKVICNGNCITTLRDGNIIRGCQSINFDCQPSATCNSCSEDRCNEGKLVETRHRCHQCDELDPNCNNAQDESSATNCPLLESDPEEDEDTCYLYLNNNSNMVRGCIHDENYRVCEQLGGACITCSGDGCNSQPTVGQLTCLLCDSESDPGCKTGPNPGPSCEVTTEKTCVVDVLFGQYEYCYRYQFGERVRRGCSKLDTEISSQQNYVRECRLDKCNDDCVEAAKCYVCDSLTNPDCIDVNFSLGIQDCTADSVSCHTCRDLAQVIRRGCGAGETFGECASCWNDPGCNNKKMLSCYSCNSQQDANCADWTNPNSIDKTICNGNCIATIRDGFVVRGCQSNSFDCPISETCNNCNEDECNGGLIPANRMRCHQCDENDADCNDAKDAADALICPDFNNDDQCYLFLNNNDKMVRGCTSDSRYKECQASDGRCITCSESGCNSIAAMKEPTISCADCTGGGACLWWQTTSKKCEKQIPYYAKETCFTYHPTTDAVTRGCTLDGNGCDESSVSCQICSSDACNNGNRVYQSCLQCTGKNKDVCSDGEKIEGDNCPRTDQLFETRGCYAKREGDAVTRGCLYELTAEEKTKCDEDKNCETCLEQNCNTKKLSSSATQLSALSALFLALVAYFVKIRV